MMSLKNAVISVAASVSLIGCAINVSPSAFFYQDTQQKPLDTTKLHAAIQKDKTSAGITRVEVKNEAGLTLRGVAVSYPDPIVNIVFYADNRMPVSENNSVIHRLGKLPANILWLDYQGVGASDKAKDLSINAIKQDALTQFDYVASAFDASIPTIVHGRGIGSYFASYVAANRKIDALVLDMVPGFSNSFTNMKLHDEVHSMQIAPILRHYEGPLWLVVGEEDKITPYPISQQLLEDASSSEKYISVIPGATHNATLKSDYAIEQYKQFLARFTQ